MPKNSNSDPVNPPHYADLGQYSALHVVEAWNCEYHIGQVVKYIQRYQAIGNTTDLRKARWYLQRYLWMMDRTKELNPIGNEPWDTSGRKPES